MKIVLQKIHVFKRVRFNLECPHCLKKITLDETVFMDSPDDIHCYKCGNKFLVLKIDNTKKDEVLIHATKQATNEK